MTSLFRAAIAGGALALAVTAAHAQEESTNNVAVKTDWNVFVETDPTECWSVSPPKKTVNTRGGQVVSARRGEILLFVTFRPGDGIKGEVSFSGGYPFKSGSTVALTVGDSNFELFTEGEWAWPASKADDAKIIEAMKRGAEARVVGMSSRGTKTTDTFSLYGFTAAMDEAARRCSAN
ncbi:invasion associated locus B family protein [Rhodovulum sulfidophilum]|uniref:invasion associated locus B family protein n=1 Tax=Rhodovulum sulfidophilum TaxID=35806 RepID=UPI001922594A|nr:invasion associated locus B family protein [Rhodovulum sulfidophilum]MBL3572996.1 hypothetical protein [Rhodovulum sulfidophilum]MCE8430829.1 invasion associated locus B family protein [Rhodovulum sulfidophilum]MCF4118086.1 invasion associated locus B family protein [Rhodovulum sulfidophilum]